MTTGRINQITILKQCYSGGASEETSMRVAEQGS